MRVNGQQSHHGIWDLEDPRYKLPPCQGKRVHCPVTNIVYEMGEQIGSGAAAVVFKARRVVPPTSPDGVDSLDMSEEFAAKVLDLRRLRLKSDFQREREKLRREVMILRKLHHPCIVNLLHVIETEDELFFFMELVKRGELFYKIIEKGSFTEDEARYILIQILCALQYLHQKNIMHRDLKPENILLAEEPSPSFYHIKVADFGLARFIRSGISEARTFVGTPQYWAPEVIDSASGISRYGPQADLWSLGCVIYVLLGGAYPFDSRLGPIDVLIKKAQFHFRYPRFQKVSENAKHLICGLLTIDPAKRFTLNDVFQHPWIQSFQIPPGVAPLPILLPFNSIECAPQLKISTRSVLGPLTYTLPQPTMDKPAPVPQINRVESVTHLRDPFSPPDVTVASPRTIHPDNPNPSNIKEIPANRLAAPHKRPKPVVVDSQDVLNTLPNSDERAGVIAPHSAGSAAVEPTAAVKMPDVSTSSSSTSSYPVWPPVAPDVFPSHQALVPIRKSQYRPVLPAFSRTHPTATLLGSHSGNAQDTPIVYQGASNLGAPGNTPLPTSTAVSLNKLFPSTFKTLTSPFLSAYRNNGLGHGLPFVNNVQGHSRGAQRHAMTNVLIEPAKTNDVSPNRHPATSSAGPSGSCSSAPHPGKEAHWLPFASHGRVAFFKTAETIFNFDELLCLQISIMRRVHWAYVILRHSPPAAKRLQECIAEQQSIQMHSAQIVQQFETTCCSVLELFPDLYLAVAERQLDFGRRLLEDMLTWILDIKTHMEYHQQRIHSFLRLVSELLDAIRAVKAATDQQVVVAAERLANEREHHKLKHRRPSTVIPVHPDVGHDRTPQQRPPRPTYSSALQPLRSRSSGAEDKESSTLYEGNTFSPIESMDTGFSIFTVPEQNPLSHRTGCVMELNLLGRRFSPRRANSFDVTSLPSRSQSNSRCTVTLFQQAPSQQRTGSLSEITPSKYPLKPPASVDNPSKTSSAPDITFHFPSDRTVDASLDDHRTITEASQTSDFTMNSCCSAASKVEWSRRTNDKEPSESSLSQTINFSLPIEATSNISSSQRVHEAHHVEKQNGFLNDAKAALPQNLFSLDNGDDGCDAKGATPTGRKGKQPTEGLRPVQPAASSQAWYMGIQAAVYQQLETLVNTTLTRMTDDVVYPDAQTWNGSPTRQKLPFFLQLQQSEKRQPSGVSIASPRPSDNNAPNDSLQQLTSSPYIGNDASSIARELLDILFFAAATPCAPPRTALHTSSSSPSADWFDSKYSSATPKSPSRRDSRYRVCSPSFRRDSKPLPVVTEPAETNHDVLKDRTQNSPLLVKFPQFQPENASLGYNDPEEKLESNRKSQKSPEPTSSHSLYQFYNQAVRMSELLLFALEEIRELDQSLRQSSAFWMNLTSVVDRLCQMKTHTERLLQYSTTSPRFADRFAERLGHYQTFWTALRDQSRRYVAEARKKLAAMQDFAIALENTADRVDTALALRSGGSTTLVYSEKL